MKTETFSHHAALRARQRTSLSPSTIEAMIGSGATLNLGSKPGIHKDHYLFHSTADAGWFVAVVDRLDGKVVTIWPLAYHENLAFAVTEEQKAKAVWLETTFVRSTTCGHGTPWKKWVITARYRTEEGFGNKVVSRVDDSEQFQGDTARFLAAEMTPSKLAALTQQLAATLAMPISVEGFTLRRGNGGDPMLVSVDGRLE